MNLVKQIVDQLSGDALNKLSSLLGIDNEAAEYAASAAVPALLAGLGDIASRSDGARQLTTALGGIDAGSFGDFARHLDGDSSGLALKGTQLLQSLFGDNMLQGLIGAIANYSGLGGTTTKSLLGYLLPLVLGTVARQWKQKGGSTSALQNLFAEQKSNIASAVPTGFSLDDIAGLTGFADSARSVAGSTQRTAEQAAPSLASWALPLLLLIGCGFLLWQLMRPREAPQAAVDRNAPETTAMKPVIPDATAELALPHLRDEFTGIFDSLGKTFTDIKDAASAEAALPTLEETNRKLESAHNAFRTLPDAGRTALQQLVTQHFDSIQSAANRVLAIPGLSERIRAVIEDIVTKLDAFRNARAAP